MSIEQTLADLRKLLKVPSDPTARTTYIPSGAETPVNLGKPLPDALPDDLPTEAEVREALGIGDNPNIQVRVMRATPFLLNALKRLDTSKAGVNAFDGVPAAQPEQEPEQVDGNTYDGTEAEPANAQILQATNKALLDVLWDVFQEVKSAQRKHDPMTSAHEGHSVIREEFEELWDHVRADTGYTGAARKEAIQLAAMAVRYVLDLNPHDD